MNSMDPEVGKSTLRPTERLNAILLLGATGAGKTPLGACLEQKGLWGRRCFHLDFGAELRRLAAGAETSLCEQDLAVVRSALAGAALLENEHFHIAEHIVRDVARQRGIGHGAWLVMNGLPRHAGQARDLDRMLQVRAVLYLEATPEVVFERIRTNAGGDRAGRIDDTEYEIAVKLAVFHERTTPLLDHYARCGVKIYRFTVTASTGPAEMVSELEESAE